MRNIAVVTGTRAEYGLLKPLIQAINEEKDINLQLLVTGMHLMSEFGNTYQQIEKDGLKIDAKIDDGLEGDNALAISKAVGKATIGFGETYNRLKPDLLVVLGDRSEILAAVTAAIISNIPVAHIHGGETTEGAYDEFIRHAITKMSHLHFASSEVYRKRIIQMGEHPSRVFNVGAIGIDSIKNLKLLNKTEFQTAINYVLKPKNLLITYHPVTLENDTAAYQFKQIIKELDKLDETLLIFTKPNSDKNGKIIVKIIDDFVAQNPHKSISFQSMGQLRYLSALQFVDAVVGNSSSGILEVPYFNIPTINIGDRQKGRLMPLSVICCRPEGKEIALALEKVYDFRFLQLIRNERRVYGEGNATVKILEVLKCLKIDTLKKSFFDINFDI
ncbi:UDP-N-acetylglucosamine 2-epimerase [Maribacter cobaltidurans]|uniref:UDP-N-acetylglucosamine 2-epimerase (Hydrolyzing) n=1 Tax=Maribacter cobaltidurans TaxID=1178778 RepID=A0A223V4F5_9FLAO|nr:UDP-N-acetylglucosamine 2-epimerase [Maribacter cobaltidurans]ASV30192.1 UDP-N-acetylglucosamine 2-epimerase (hydrolyzing) [Maribacter cobaltidurans]GGD76508.1 UDP-N-acetyl glucosamine 2-epimerase [Maribacter cobaltidurans]